MNREELIRIASRITELRTEIARLSGLREELRHLETQLDEMAGTVPPRVQTRTRQTQSLEQVIADFLDKHADKEWTADDVASETGAKVPTTRAVFSKLRKSRRIKDTRRGYVQSTKMAGAPPEQENILPFDKVA